MLFFGKKNKIEKEKPDWIVVGLGNPGDKYKNTRHNIGWMVAEEFLKSKGTNFKYKTIAYKYNFIAVNNFKVLVAVPLTYMNNSGVAVKEILNKTNLLVEKLIIILDEYNFPLGKIHVKMAGGDGGHNGMASIIEHLNSSEFIRLRCGIGKNFGPGELIDYVLSDFSPEEIDIKNAMIKTAIEAIEAIIKFGSSKAFSLINSGDLWK